MDLCTACNLLLFCPRDLPSVVFSEFLEKRLMMAVQQQGPEGYDIRKALLYIINNYDAHHGPEQVD